MTGLRQAEFAVRRGVEQHGAGPFDVRPRREAHHFQSAHCRIVWDALGKMGNTGVGMTVPQSMQLAYDLTNLTIKNQTQVIAELQNILDTP